MQVVNSLEYKSDEVMNKILFHFVVFFTLYFYSSAGRRKQLPPCFECAQRLSALVTTADERRCASSNSGSLPVQPIQAFVCWKVGSTDSVLSQKLPISAKGCLQCHIFKPDFERPADSRLISTPKASLTRQRKGTSYCCFFFFFYINYFSQ